MQFLFTNDTEYEKEVLINVNYLGQLDVVVENVPSGSTKLLTYKISNIKPSEIKFAVTADNNSFIKVTVPENFHERDVLLVHQITADEWKRSLPGEGIIDKVASSFKHLLASPDAVAVATVLLIATAALIAIRLVFRKKSKGEKKVAINEKLLKAVKEIENKK
ncbi:MAG: hypothetical protein CL943_00250 [Candidatus Diapherotrites archaeon]|uniref:Uncharacterized protein n=1 Tax=Candidatus Iainarchaeum sp. TaxID=3101447 RepID=A0A2D6LZY4_9ARCH|nr:hypothetical protein [Candidatus Diapherotrites archaeon]|tara:strand:+ start:1128 stop:1616 length:489 start_codon:yes stop_codon:yes gene_type:complete